MGKYELENSREFKAAQELENALNNMSWNSEKFAESITVLSQDTPTKTVRHYDKGHRDDGKRGLWI